MSILNERQKTFLDDIEEPVPVASHALEIVRQGGTHMVIKNGRQMTFRGIATLKAVADYLLDVVRNK